MGKYKVFLVYDGQFGFTDQYWSVYANGSTHGINKEIKYTGTGGFRSAETSIIYSNGFKNAFDGSEGFASFSLDFRTYSQNDWSAINGSLIESGSGWYIEDDNGVYFLFFPESIEYTPTGTYKHPWKHEWSLSGIGRRL